MESQAQTVDIECFIKREGGTRVDMPSGKSYHFKPNAEGHHVATVADRHDLAAFLKIPEGYGLYGTDAAPAEMVAPEPQPTSDASKPIELTDEDFDLHGDPEDEDIEPDFPDGEDDSEAEDLSEDAQAARLVAAGDFSEEVWTIDLARIAFAQVFGRAANVRAGLPKILEKLAEGPTEE